MIYLIITTSIHNKVGKQDPSKRRDQYLNAISETLQFLPKEIMPVIVENNGLRETYLDYFHHFSNPVKVIYTQNNLETYKNKGVNEMFDIKEVIQKLDIQNTDMIIKLTGRYRITSSAFFDEVIKNKEDDAFLKFYNADRMMFHPSDCILGLYALRAMYFKMLNPLSFNHESSPESKFAKYIRFSKLQLKEVNHLGLECVFADDFRVVEV